jgi:purine nucleoside permease
LPDSDSLKAYRAKYVGFPLAQMPPRVMMGDSCMPPPGQSIESTLNDISVGTLPAYEADYRAATAVAHELLRDWARYEDTIPRAGK